MVSVVVPAQGLTRWLPEALQSVRNQSWSDFECLVVATPGSRTSLGDSIDLLADDSRFRILERPKVSLGNARNEGIRASGAPYVAFLDADDVWLPHKLEVQLSLLRARRDTQAVVSGYILADARLRPTGVILPHESSLYRWLMSAGPGWLLGSTTLFRTGAIHELGLFDESMGVSADLDLAVRLQRRFDPLFFEAPLTVYRVHRQGLHLQTSVRDVERRWVIDRYISEADRQRAIANLNLRLAYGYWRDGQPGRGVVRLSQALRRPGVVASVPTIVVADRARRRWNKTVRAIGASTLQDALREVGPAPILSPDSLPSDYAEPERQ